MISVMSEAIRATKKDIITLEPLSNLSLICPMSDWRFLMSLLRSSNLEKAVFQRSEHCASCDFKSVWTSCAVTLATRPFVGQILFEIFQQVRILYHSFP